MARCRLGVVVVLLIALPSLLSLSTHLCFALRYCSSIVAEVLASTTTVLLEIALVVPMAPPQQQQPPTPVAPAAPQQPPP